MMGDEKPTYEELKARLAVAERTLNAIRNEEIDALIGRKGVYLLRLKGLEDALSESVERVKETNQELNEYAYALTHNLKAPLRAINNYVNFLYEDLSETLEGEPKTYLERLKGAVTQSNKQFEDLEALYKVKNHSENFESFEMSELIGEIQSIFKNTSDRKLIVAKEWPVFRGERFLIRQILIELIKNGFKFNRADIRCVEVGWQMAEGNGIELFVRDNGIGIEEQYQQQIFNIFRRLHTEREYDGTGIGLAIVKRANQKIGGRLRLESPPGQGSTFYVSLPKSMLKRPS